MSKLNETGNLEPLASSPPGTQTAAPQLPLPAEASAGALLPEAPMQMQSPPIAQVPLDAEWGDISRKRRPLLGPSIWIFGATLWAYAVMGEWVINFDLSERLAFLSVIAVFAISWYSSTGYVPGGKLREKILPCVFGLGLWSLALLLAAAVFKSSRRADEEGVTVGLWVLAAAAYFIGRYLSTKRELPVSKLVRARTIFVWIVAMLATAIALGSAFESM